MRFVWPGTIVRAGHCPLCSQIRTWILHRPGAFAQDVFTYKTKGPYPRGSIREWIRSKRFLEQKKVFLGEKK